jgi:hypothetical protein
VWKALKKWMKLQQNWNVTHPSLLNVHVKLVIGLVEEPAVNQTALQPEPQHVLLPEL